MPSQSAFNMHSSQPGHRPTEINCAFLHVYRISLATHHVTPRAFKFKSIAKKVSFVKHLQNPPMIYTTLNPNVRFATTTNSERRKQNLIPHILPNQFYHTFVPRWKWCVRNLCGRDPHFLSDERGCNSYDYNGR